MCRQEMDRQMDSQLPMWLGPPTKWAAKSTGPEIGEGPRARLCISLFVCLFWSCGNFQAAGGPDARRGARGCCHPGLADIPIRPGYPSHQVPARVLLEDSTHSEGVQLRSGQMEAVTQLCTAVQALAHPLPALRRLLSQGCVSLCLTFPSHCCCPLQYLPSKSQFPSLLILQPPFPMVLAPTSRYRATPTLGPGDRWHWGPES